MAQPTSARLLPLIAHRLLCQTRTLCGPCCSELPAVTGAYRSFEVKRPSLDNNDTNARRNFDTLAAASRPYWEQASKQTLPVALNLGRPRTNSKPFQLGFEVVLGLYLSNKNTEPPSLRNKLF